jgi:hypothetical protein
MKPMLTKGKGRTATLFPDAGDRMRIAGPKT